ncbi:MAG: tRNA 2-thiocytidine biosynthesis protein TtcA [Spirochaetales bacterium]|nr:tRNA 2-thiocytidine biosynthesis protein TtcA [Spirochaetales bacterium]
MADAGHLISKRIGQAIYKYKLIEPNDKILVAVSGGKDSMTLLHDLKRRQKSFPVKYEFVAVHIQTDFCSCCKKSDLENKFKEWEVPYEIIDVPVLKRLKPGRKMSCYWCSTQRRMELIKYAAKSGCNKIALGHHLDDIIETLFMNMCYKGEMATMLPKLYYDKYDHVVIRPLALVSEKLIIKFAEKAGITRLICKCPYGTQSKRLNVREAITMLAKQDDSIRLNLLKAMSNVNLKYLVSDDQHDYNI